LNRRRYQFAMPRLAWQSGRMHKRSSKPADDKTDTSEPQKNPAAVALGRLGGLKGGKARAAALSKTERSAIAKKAAATRWKKKAEE
jgi:hypothetical protein